MSKPQYIKAYCYDKRGRLLSVGQNSYKKTHPLQAHFAAQVGLHDKQFRHAEIDALLKAKGKQVHRIHVERFIHGKEALAAPCPICMYAIQKFGVKVISYTVGPS